LHYAMIQFLIILIILIPINDRFSLIHLISPGLTSQVDAMFEKYPKIRGRFLLTIMHRGIPAGS